MSNDTATTRHFEATYSTTPSGKAWYRCDHCSGHRLASAKLGAQRDLMCEWCTYTTRHTLADTTAWERDADWRLTLLRNLGVDVTRAPAVDTLSSGTLVAYEVTGIRDDEGLIRFRVAFSPALAPWGFPVALRHVLSFLARADRWCESEWSGDSLSWSVGMPARNFDESDWLASDQFIDWATGL